jgi:hypothetical protein
MDGMKWYVLLGAVLGGFLGGGGYTPAWAEKTDIFSDSVDEATKKETCQKALAEDEKRDESKLTDEFKAKCKLILTPTPPLAAVEQGPSSASEGAQARAGNDYPDEAQKGWGATGSAAAQRQGYLDSADKSFKNQDNYVGTEHEADYLKGVTAQHHEAQQRNAQFEQNLPTPEYPTTAPEFKPSDLTGVQPTPEAVQAENRAKLQAEENTPVEKQAWQDKVNKIIQTGSSQDELGNTFDGNRVDVQGKVATPEPQTDIQPVAFAPLEKASTQPAISDQAEARVTAGRSASELLQQGYLGQTKDDTAAMTLSYCHEQRRSEDVCSSVIQTIARESNFNPYAKNSGSSAYGFGQYINSTWQSECTKFLNLNSNDCAARRSDPKTQMDVLIESTQRRKDLYDQGRLDCKGIQGFDACNYIVYHHTFAAGDPIGYYSSTLYNTNKVYQAAHYKISGDNPELALAQLTLSKVSAVNPNLDPRNLANNSSYGYLRNQNSNYWSTYYSPGWYGYDGYSNYAFPYGNAVSYAPFQPNMPYAQQPQEPLAYQPIISPKPVNVEPAPEKSNEEIRPKSNPNLLPDSPGNSSAAPTDKSKDPNQRGYELLNSV